MSRSLEHAFQADEIMAYLDGELEPRRAASLVSHLDHCAECQALANQFRQVSERMLEFKIEASPASVGNAVFVALDSWKSESKTEPNRSGFRKPGAWRRL